MARNWFECGLRSIPQESRGCAIKKSDGDGENPKPAETGAKGSKTQNEEPGGMRFLIIPIPRYSDRIRPKYRNAMMPLCMGVHSK